MVNRQSRETGNSVQVRHEDKQKSTTQKHPLDHLR
jgi:hypothetical protein